MTPVEIRKLIIKNREEGVKVSEISRILKVSESAIYSICRKYEERKHLNGNYPGRKPKITEEQKKEFEKRFGQTVEAVYGEAIEKLIQLKMLAETGDRLYLTEQGINVSNEVFTNFLKIT